MHKSFLPLFIISLFGVLGSSFINHENTQYHWIGLISGLSPLVSYYYFLSKKNILSPSEIDSVYYFGFLITVITLVSTAIAIGIATKLPEIKWILLQFGLGLIATGIALFARLMLMTKSSNSVEIDVVESSKILVSSVNKVSGEFDNASYIAKSFVDQLQIRLNEMVSESENRFRDNLQNSLDIYTTSIESISEATLLKCSNTIETSTKNFSDALTLIVAEIKRIENEAASVSFQTAGVRLEEFSLQIQTSLSDITNKTTEVSSLSAAGIAELGSTTRKVQKLAIDIAGKLEKIDQIQNLLQSIINTSDALDVLNQATSTASSSVTKLNSTSAEAAKTIDRQIIEPLATSGIQTGLLHLNVQFPEKMEMFGNSIDSLNKQAIDLMSAVATSKNLIERTLGNLAQANLTHSNFSELDKTAQALAVGLKDLLDTSRKLKTNLDVEQKNVVLQTQESALESSQRVA